jgi:formyl-CoA transferase
MPGNPVKLSHANEESYSSPPHLGSHTKEILKDWSKYSEDKIQTLIKENIIQSVD